MPLAGSVAGTAVDLGFSPPLTQSKHSGERVGEFFNGEGGLSEASA